MKLISRWGVFGILALVFVPTQITLASQATFAPELRGATGPGALIDGADGTTQAEIFSFDSQLSAGLSQAPFDSPIHILNFPVGPAERADVVVSRREIYAQDAKTFRADGAGLTELPRSNWAFLWGTAVDDPELSVLVIVDPTAKSFRGFARSTRGTWEFRPRPEAGKGKHLVAPADFFLSEATDKAPEWACDQESVSQPELPRGSEAGGAIRAISSLHQMTVAYDTDNEFMLQKFADNTTNATNYIASLTAAMNVMYERDLLVRLLVGTTILRVSTTTDPWLQNSGGAASGAELQEFSSFWSANQAGVTRGLSALLSGKSPTSNSASGIAWVSGLCSTSFGYSFSKVFKIDFLSGDASLVGHELGHNFGSPHTHCYTPPIDNCFNGEGGCYAGATSCPAATTINGVTNVRGTLMSYCHLLGGCSASSVFHPTSVSLLQPLIMNRVGVCIFPNGPVAPTVTAVNPKSGSTAGGTSVTISGTNFLAGATVSIGGTAATSVVVVNSTTITAVTPAHATGAVSASVTNVGSSAGSLANAYFYAPPPTASNFFTLTPCRVLDTRNATGPLGGPALAANSTRVFTVTGVCGIPSTAKAISANLTVAAPTATGTLSVYPGNAFPFNATAMNYKAGQTRANNAMVMIATDGTGTFGIQNAAPAAVHFLLDVNGYFE